MNTVDESFSGRGALVARSSDDIHTGRELLGLGAIVLALAIAFAALVVEPTQASMSGPVGLDRAPPANVFELPNDPPLRSGDEQGLDTTATAPETAPVPDAAALPEAPAAPPEAAAAARPPPVPTGMRVRVARLSIDLPVLFGDTTRDTVLRSTPIGAAFLLPGTTPPGTGGNSYIYAHARTGMFLALWDVHLGDVVEVTAASSEVRRYVVTEIHPRVGPTDVRYTLPTGDERITLQTSTGPNDSDPRFIVVAVRGG